MFLQPQQLADENRDRPDRYRPARCGNPNPTGSLLIGWGSWSQRAARGESCPSANADVPANTGRISSHPQIRNPSMSLQLQQTGDENADPSSPYRSAVWKLQPHWLVADWLGLMKPARCENCPSGHRRGPTPPGEDRVSSPEWKSFHISTNRLGDENGDPSGRYRPARCENLNHTGWLLIGGDSWGLRAATVAPRDNVEFPPHPGRIGSYPRIINHSISLQLTPTIDLPYLQVLPANNFLQVARLIG